MKPGGTILIFITGLLAGWGIHRGVAGQDHPASTTATSTTGTDRGKGDRAPVTEDARWAAFGKKARLAGMDDMDGILKEVAPADRMTALESLMAQAGLRGLGNVLENLMERIVWDWVADDLDGAWAAAQACTDPDLRGFMVEIILAKVAQTEPDRALELELQQAAEDPDFKTDAVPVYQKKMLKVGAAEYMESIKRFPLKVPSDGPDGVFAEDFDFRRVADEVTAMLKENGGKGPGSFPRNFLRSWADKDPQAAYDWWAANPALKFNDVNGIIAGFEKNSPGGSTAWLIGKLQDPSVPRERLIAELCGGSNEELLPRISNIAGAITDPAESDAFLRDVFVARSYGSMERSAFALAGMSSPEVRLEALRAMAAKHGGANMGKVTDAQLAAWGITRQQAQQALGK